MRLEDVIRHYCEGNLHTARLVPLGRGDMEIELVDPQTGEVHAYRLRLLRPPRNEGHPLELYRTRAVWTEAELRAEKRPLYWSRAWLLDQLITHRSVRGVINANPECRLTPAIVNRWRLRHKIPEHAHHQAVRDAWESGEFRTRSDLAQHFQLSTTTISRILASPPGSAD